MRYHKPISEVPWTGKYPDLADFINPCSLRVHTDEARISVDGRKLYSTGFSECSGLILRNTSNLESCLFHVGSPVLSGLQSPFLQALMGNFMGSLDPVDKGELLSTLAEVVRYERPTAMGLEGFQARMEELNANGVMQACVVRGKESHECRVEFNMLRFLGVKVVKHIRVRTGHPCWSMVYSPREHLVQVASRSEMKVFGYRF